MNVNCGCELLWTISFVPLSHTLFLFTFSIPNSEFFYSLFPSVNTIAFPFLPFSFSLCLFVSLGWFKFSYSRLHCNHVECKLLAWKHDWSMLNVDINYYEMFHLCHSYLLSQFLIYQLSNFFRPLPLILFPSLPLTLFLFLQIFILTSMFYHVYFL